MKNSENPQDPTQYIRSISSIGMDFALLLYIVGNKTDETISLVYTDRYISKCMGVSPGGGYGRHSWVRSYRELLYIFRRSAYMLQSIYIYIYFKVYIHGTSNATKT